MDQKIFISIKLLSNQREVPYGGINLLEIMYSLPTISRAI
jgi:hypothetical protein